MINNSLWKNQVGVLPVNFLHSQTEEQRIYAMLNGYAHNFCVGYDCAYVDDVNFRSKVWSANMSTYMSIGNDEIKLYDLYRSNPENISIKEVERDIQRFYRYLSFKSIHREDGVIELVLNKFKEIRSSLREENSARESLLILLKLLSLLEGNIGIDWNLPQEDFFRNYQDTIQGSIAELNIGLSLLGVKPNVDMILRHCAGILFQEANFIAHFPPQLSLFPSIDYSIEKNPNLVGAYFTPSYIARTIVEESLKRVNLQTKELIVFDPACGSGVFLAECLRQLKTMNYSGRVNVIGWDVDPIAVDMSNFVLSFEKKEWGDKMNYQISNVDSLEEENVWPESDVILMNPPYISWYMMNEPQRSQVARILNGINYRPNLSVLFYILATKAIKNNGVIGSLMPSAFLSSDSIEMFRKGVNEEVPPVLIGQLGNYVFTPAYVDVSMIIAQKGTNIDTTQLLWTKNSNNVSEKALRALRRSGQTDIDLSTPEYNIYKGSYSLLLKNDRWSPLSKDSMELQRKLDFGLNSGWLVPVETIFDVRQGARTGANNIFILSNAEYSNLPRNERKYFRPSVDNEAIHYGFLQPVNYIFYPYPENERGFSDEEELARTMPTYYHNTLSPNRERLMARSKINVDKWWSLSWPRTWQYQSSVKLISTEFGSAGSYSIDFKGTSVVERGMCWMPRNAEISLDEMCFYLAILNSDFYNDLLLVYSRQLAGGAFNLETKYVKNIPLPRFEMIDEPLKKQLISVGRNSLNGIKINQDSINVMIKHIYGTN